MKQAIGTLISLDFEVACEKGGWQMVIVEDTDDEFIQWRETAVNVKVWSLSSLSDWLHITEKGHEM